MHCLHYTLKKKKSNPLLIYFIFYHYPNQCLPEKSTSYNMVHLYVLFPYDFSKSFYSSIIPLDHQTLRVDLAMRILLPWWKEEQHEKGELMSGKLLAKDGTGEKGSGGSVY